jgi:hypothetical protein
MAQQLSEAKIAAALSEQVYRRAKEDMAISDSDFADGFGITINATEYARMDTKQTGLVADKDGYYYNYSTGFCARVVEIGDTIYIVYRGSDASSADFKAAVATGATGWDGFFGWLTYDTSKPTSQNGNGEVYTVDKKDWVTNGASAVGRVWQFGDDYGNPGGQVDGGARRHPRAKRGNPVQPPAPPVDVTHHRRRRHCERSAAIQ